jgi:zinc protease
VVRGPRAQRAGARIAEFVLGNGMRLLIAEREGDPAVALMTFYRVGVRNEREHEAGFSHLLEHMMFKGSRRFGKGEVDRITAELGGSNNAFTGYDHTGYWFELASDRFEIALAMEADRLAALNLEAAEFESEREVVLEELAGGLDNPWRALGDAVQHALFERHPYRRPIIGYPDSLRAASVQNLRDYYERFYQPANATLVLAGGVQQASALELAHRHFGPLRSTVDYRSADCFRGGLEEPRGERRLQMRWSDQGRRLCMAWPTVPVGSDDDYTLDVIHGLLAGGRTSRLYRELVLKRGVATSVSASNDTRVDTGVLWVTAECAQGVQPADLEAAVDRELERLSAELVPAAELRGVQSMLLASEAYDTETASDFAEQLGELAVDADWRIFIDGSERLSKVSARAVRDCARRLLRPHRRVVGWCIPEEERAALSVKPGMARARRARKQAARRGRRTSRRSSRRRSA